MRRWGHGCHREADPWKPAVASHRMRGTFNAETCPAKIIWQMPPWGRRQGGVALRGSHALVVIRY